MRAEHIALDHEHVQVAVIVDVDDGDARPHGFRVVQFAGHPIEVNEIKSCLDSAIREPIDAALNRERSLTPAAEIQWSAGPSACQTSRRRSMR
jgi:hypothetical protein